MFKSILTFAVCVVIGVSLIICGVVFSERNHAQGDKLTTLKHPVKATLYRFKINKKNMAVYREWVKWHHDEYLPMIKTLERERMYFESVFRDTIKESDVIYWLTINGEGGETSNTSTIEIDRKHNEYMKKILIKGSGNVLKTEFSLMPEFITQSIAAHQQSN